MDETPSPMSAGLLQRWLHESSADTRRADGPEPRVYEVAFARVWDELLAYVDGRSRWRLAHRDEELGLISVACTSLVFRFVDDLTIWVALDANGLTRVEVLSASRRGRGDLGVNRRRIERMLRALDQTLGPSARLADDRGQGGTIGLAGGPPGDGATIA